MGVVKNMMVRAGADFSAVTTQAKKAAKSMRTMQADVSRSCSGMKASIGSMKKVLSGLGVAVGISAVISAAKVAAEAYDKQSEAEIKLATVMRNTMKARNSEIQSVLDLCSAQQKLGIIGDEVQLAGAQELATYLTKTSTLKKLIPVMNDMAAQQYGYNVTAENTTTIATMLGKVMNGQVSALSRLGYTFSEAQAEILKYGNEEDRAATLAKVINQSVGGMNRTLASTPAGRMQQLSNALGDIREKFGECVRLIGVLLLPLLWKVADVLAKVADFASRAAVSINKVFGSTASLTGWQTISAGVSGVSDELESATTQAKELKRTVMSFDTLNILGGKEKEETAQDSTSADQSAQLGTVLDDLGSAQARLGERWEKLLTGIKTHMNDLANLALGVGTAIAGWKIAQGLKMGLKDTFSLISSLEGAAFLVKGAFRSWKDGVSWSSLIDMLGGTAMLTLGLGSAFGKVGTSIGLLTGGLTMAVTAGLEWYRTGELTTQSFASLELGIGAVGAAISLLTGTWLPLAIAGIADFALWLYQYSDEINVWWESTIIPAISAAIDWIVEGFNWVKTEIGFILQETLNVAMEIGGGIRDFFVSAVNLITTTAQVAAALVKQHFEQLKAATVATFTAIKTTVQTAITTAKTAIVTAVTQAKTTAVAQWNAMLSSCRSIFTSLHSHITQTIQTATNYLASVSWYSIGVNLMQGFLNGLRSLMSTIWNEVVDFVRRCTEAVRNALGVHSPSKVFEEIGVMVDRGALKGLRSGMPDILAEGQDMAEQLVNAVSPAALNTADAYRGLSRDFPTANGDVAFSGEESMYGIMNVLDMIYDALLAGHEIHNEIDGETIFNTVVRQNNRAINRTGISPIRG